MIIETEDIIYNADLKQCADYLQVMYNNQKDGNEVLILPNGKTFDMKKGSITRTILKGIITPVIIPILSMIFTLCHDEILPYKRGSDLFDYVVSCMLYLMGTHINKATFYAITENSSNNSKNIVKLSTVKQERAESNRLPERKTESIQN